MLVSINNALRQLNDFYTEKLVTHGATPKGVDYNGAESQEIRFDQLLKLCTSENPFSILDYGCSYGALADYLVAKGFEADYYGYDIVEKAIELARQVHAGKARRTFFIDNQNLPVCDYVVASGIFNFSGDTPFDTWTNFVTGELQRFDQLSRKGFASNFLTKYSDADKMRPNLYYADPGYIFDFCKKTFSKNVALLHDYNLYDFTILVRKG
jgi:SAM-dependent methyltransferase